MTTRGKFLAAAAVVVALVAVLYVAREVGVPGAPTKRPENLDTDLRFKGAGSGCDKDGYPEILRADATKDRELSWTIYNSCDGDITVCLDDFTFEKSVSDPQDNNPLQGSPPYCEKSVPAGNNRTLKVKVKGEAEDGIFLYEIYLTVQGGASKKVDPVIDIIR